MLAQTERTAMQALVSTVPVLLAESGGGTKLPMTLVSLVVLLLAIGLTAGWVRMLYR
jgi:hypothetical protein